MKSKYCFIRKVGNLRPNDFIYTVYVGESEREQTLLYLVREYSKDCGLYLRKWSAQVDSMLTLAAKPFRSGRALFLRPFRRASLSIRELYRLIIDDSFDVFEENFKESHFSVWLSFCLRREYVGCYNRLKVSQKRLPKKSKNLSPEYQDNGFSLAFATLLIFLSLVAHTLFGQWCLHYFGAF